MPVNDVTTNRSYQKPNIANTLSDDVGRLRSALDAIDTDMASKAPSAGPTFTGVTTVAAGSAAAPSLTFTGATSDTGLYSPGADQVALSTAGTGRLFVDASGRVGVGVGTPSRDFVLSGSNVTYLKVTEASLGTAITDGFDFMIDNGANAYLWNRENGTLIFGTNNTERLRITSDGKIGIGTSSPDALLTVNGVGAFGAGSAAAPSIAITGDLNTGLYSPGADQLALSTGGAGRLFVDASGKVGIGTSSPEATLDCRGSIISSNGTTRYAVLGTDTDGAYLGTAGLAQPLIFKNGNGSTDVERARIDSSGRLLVGTSTARSNLVFSGTGIAPLYQIESTGPESSLSIIRNATNNNSGPRLVLAKNKSATAGTNVIVGSSEILGEISFNGNDGTNFISGAAITAITDGTPGLDDMPGRLVFSTTADGAGSPTERMVIKADGKVGIGTSSPGMPLEIQGVNADGVTLRVFNGVTTNPTVINNGSESTLKIRGGAFYGGGQIDLVGGIAASGAGNILFRTGTSAGEQTERARIDTSGRLLVGTSTATSGQEGQYANLQVAGNSSGSGGGAYVTFARDEAATSITANEMIARITFGNTGPAEFAYISCLADAAAGASDYPGRLVFATTGDGTATPAEAMRINNQRELLIGTTTRTANGGVLQVSNGITFPGTQSACSDPNTLDDYEEGTFTPTIIGTTSAGVGTYTIQVGRYTKIGNRVCFSLYLSWSAHTGTGNSRVSGLPFSSNSVSNNLVPLSYYLNNCTLSANNVLMPYVNAGSTEIALAQGPVGGGAASSFALDTAAEIMLAGVYEV